MKSKKNTARLQTSKSVPGTSRIRAHELVADEELRNTASERFCVEVDQRTIEITPFEGEFWFDRLGCQESDQLKHRSRLRQIRAAVLGVQVEATLIESPQSIIGAPVRQNAGR
jgi:hypothetical protein